MADSQKKHGENTPNNFLYVGDRPSTDAEVPISLGIVSVLVNVTKKVDLDVIQLTDLSSLRGLLLK